MFCRYCGKENKDDAKFCVGCGKMFENDDVAIKEREKQEGASEVSGKDDSPKTLLIAFIILIALAVVVIAVVIVLGVKRFGGNEGGEGSEVSRDRDTGDEDRVKDKKTDADDIENEGDEEDSGKNDTMNPEAKAALIAKIKRIENEYAVSIYTVRDFNGDDIYEMLLQSADLSAEIGRFAYDGSDYQEYGTSDEGWAYYSQEENLQYYSYSEMLAFLEDGVPLPETPEWMTGYAGWLESRAYEEPIYFTMAAIDNDEIPECLVWREVDNDKWRSCLYILSYKENGVVEYESGEVRYLVFSCPERSGKFIVGSYSGLSEWWDIVELSTSGFEQVEELCSGQDADNEDFYVIGSEDVDQETYEQYIIRHAGNVQITDEDSGLLDIFRNMIGGYKENIETAEAGTRAYYGANYVEVLKGAYALWQAKAR